MCARLSSPLHLIWTIQEKPAVVYRLYSTFISLIHLRFSRNLAQNQFVFYKEGFFWSKYILDVSYSCWVNCNQCDYHGYFTQYHWWTHHMFLSHHKAALQTWSPTHLHFILYFFLFILRAFEANFRKENVIAKWRKYIRLQKLMFSLCWRIFLIHNMTW